LKDKDGRGKVENEREEERQSYQLKMKSTSGKGSKGAELVGPMGKRKGRGENRSTTVGGTIVICGRYWKDA
jgi:hypothetical protein